MNDLVVAIEAIVVAANPSFVQKEPSFVAKREREDFACLPAKSVRLWKRDVREMKRDHILDGELRHLSKRTVREGPIPDAKGSDWSPLPSRLSLRLSYQRRRSSVSELWPTTDSLEEWPNRPWGHGR